MLLRSSSTPILGSLLASSSSCSSPHFSDSPNHHHHHHHHPLERTHSDNPHKLSFHHTGAAHPHLSAPSPHAFYRPPAASELPDPQSGGFRRVRSDGNLRDMAAAAEAAHDDLRRINHVPLPMRSGSRRPSSHLESIPSFSYYGSGMMGVAEEEEEVGGKDGIERSVTIGETIEGEFSFSGDKGNAATNAGQGAGAPSPLFLAMGLGLEAGDGAAGLIVGFEDGAGGGGGGGNPAIVDHGGDQSDMEAYYKKMVEEDPGNALFLRNYAQFLYQSKGDPKRAEEYYSRAILAQPGDGEVLSQYAKLIWELHHDRQRASSYFEQAVQAAPQDSHVLAAYAGFLWETEDEQDGDDGEAGQSQDYLGTHVPYGTLASANVR